jgi:hypothetical protein
MGKGTQVTPITCAWWGAFSSAGKINRNRSRPDECQIPSISGSTTPKSKCGRNLSTACVKKRTKNQNAINGGIQPHL